MAEIEISPATAFLRQFVPSYRFDRATAAPIDRHHRSHTALSHNSIKILNWNVAKNTNERGWMKDFLKILRQHLPNLVSLQEVCMEVGTEYAIGLMEMGWSFAPNFIDKHHNRYSGVLTAAHANPVARRLLLTEHYEPITKTPKVSLITEYSLLNRQQTLLVVNTHIINFVSLDKFKHQLHEIEAAIARHIGPVIFAGDFNTWNWARGTLLQETAARLGLIQVTFSDADHQQLKRFLTSPPLDYIFYRGLKERPFSAKVLSDIDSSDHKPMLVEFSIDEP